MTIKKITPFLWFDKEAMDAAKFYVSIFPKSKIKNVNKFDNTPSGTIEIIDINLAGQDFTLMSAGPYFKFNESISFLIDCKNQKEIDYYWKALSKGGKESQCGWLKDKFGVSWQIVPKELDNLIIKDKTGKVMQEMLKMSKIDINKLKRAVS